MTILIDPPAWPFRGQLFSHVASDVSIAELHAFARRVGLHPRSYDGDHYDVPAQRYDEVVAAGAVPVTNRALLSAVQAAGLRFRKRRGERPVDSLVGAVGALDVAHRLDLFLSPFEAPSTTTVAAAVVLGTGWGKTLLVPDAAERTPGARASSSGSGWGPPWVWLDAEQASHATVAALLARWGLTVDEPSLRPVAQLRLTCADAPGHPRLHRVSHVAVYGATLGDRAGRGEPDEPLPGDVPASGASLGVPAGAVWVDDATAGRRCGGAPWWPLLERYLDDNRASSTARLSRADASHG